MTNLNPLTLLDNVLEEYASPRARRAIHAALMLVAAGVTIYLAAGKDWEQALIALAATLYTAANKANTDPVDTAPDDEPEEAESLIFSAVPEFGEDDHGDEADYDYGIVRADPEEPIPDDLPTDTIHGGESE